MRIIARSRLFLAMRRALANAAVNGRGGRDFSLPVRAAGHALRESCWLNHLRRTRVFAVVCASLLLCSAVHVGADARIDYLLHCAGCHLPDASGSPPEVPPLANELGRIVAIPGGRDYVVRVPGASQAPINDRALAEVINWLLAEFNGTTLPAAFEPLTAEEVHRSRVNVLADPIKHRDALWTNYVVD